MKNLITGVVSVLLAGCLVTTLAAPAAHPTRKPTKREIYVITKILQPLKYVANNAALLESVLAKDLGRSALAALEKSSDIDMPAKRQGASWDLDYGWGGGRFGKRADDKNKRYDMYGFGGGRFGRDVDHVDVDGHH